MGQYTQALNELGRVAEAIDPRAVDRSLGLIAGAGRILAYGCGREGLQLRGLAMRLHHLGLSVAMQGDMAAPPLGPGDLFLCSAGPGDLSTVTALMRVAHDAGAQVLLLTAEPDKAPGRWATQILTIPAQTMARDVGGASMLPMGSLYEGALFLLFEIMVLELRDRLGETMETMRARHTNME
ncbi:3-hexulose-6-phosphate isomerase [Hoeflea marina]|uniref:3-hexulose-6-phosphate isomerase n=1 Tax=Hoeflea marina TaxID=274592 RepID=A0A317PLU6_9HYPH|nr:6-phospho-3-hexuloisomerase [Hoeflea marina]PWW00017.1 3-hexulose-6-phosphate isomerase [Hoeflea marina]